MSSTRADWSRLTKWLVGCEKDQVVFTWDELGAIVGGLPASADDHLAFWYGDRPHTRAWIRAGYKRVAIDHKARTITLKKAMVSHDPEAVLEAFPQLSFWSSLLSKLRKIFPGHVKS